MTDAHPEAPSSAGENETALARLARLTERFRISKTTKRLIAEAIDRTFRPGNLPDEPLMRKVCDGIEVFVLAGLDSDHLITSAINEAKARAEEGEDWRQRLWSDLLAAANQEYERLGRPDDLLGPPLQVLAPIPPQPATELEDDQPPLAA
jgi:hypothetical protein